MKSLHPASATSPRALSSNARRWLAFTVFVGLLSSACNVRVDMWDPNIDMGSGGKSENSGTSDGAGGSQGVGSGAGGGAGGQSGGPMPTSLADLCGGPDAACVPGTSDCTLGGNPGMGTGGTTMSMIGCQLSEENGAVVASCKDVGSFDTGSPCQSAADCAAGLGCVATPSGGICRPYCCGNVEDCPTTTFCAAAQMAESSLNIPVCVPAKSCALFDDSTCPDGQTCTLVRPDDGTTSCVTPGVGVSNEPCPCAPGFFCSALNQCVKLCRIGNDAADCNGGTCQGGLMNLPNDTGVCAAP